MDSKYDAHSVWAHSEPAKLTNWRNQFSRNFEQMADVLNVDKNGEEL